jgi:hypothetical protein
MSGHNTSRWVLLRRELKPRLMARLPHPCPRCGQVMEKGMKLDLGHISRDPASFYDPNLLRLEHQACNRRHGQSITTALRTTRKPSKRSQELPGW